MLLSSTFGPEILSMKVPFLKNGQKKQQSLSKAITSLWNYANVRHLKFEAIFLPYLQYFYYSRKDLEFK
jgi:hypothetical protein